MRTEIFVLGTAMYFMEKGAEPRHELEDPWDTEEIQRRVAAREFPDTAELVLGAVIRKCWYTESSMREVMGSIGAERSARLYQSRLTDDSKDTI